MSIKFLPQALAHIGRNPCDSNPPVMWNGSSVRAAEIIAAEPTQDNLFVPYGDYLYYSKKVDANSNPVWYRLNLTEDGCELYSPDLSSQTHVAQVDIIMEPAWVDSVWTPTPTASCWIMMESGTNKNMGSIYPGSRTYEFTGDKPVKFQINSLDGIYRHDTAWINFANVSGFYKGYCNFRYPVRSHTFNIEVLGAVAGDINSGEIVNNDGDVLQTFDFSGDLGYVQVDGISVDRSTHPASINMTWGPASGQTFIIRDRGISAQDESWVPFNGSVEQTVCIVEVRFYWYQEPVTGMRVNFYDDTNYLYGNFTDDSGLASYTILDSSVPPPLLRVEVNHSHGSVGGGQSHVFVFDERFYNLDYTIDETVNSGIQYEIYHAVVNLQDYGNTLG